MLEVGSELPQAGLTIQLDVQDDTQQRQAEQDTADSFPPTRFLHRRNKSNSRRSVGKNHVSDIAVVKTKMCVMKAAIFLINLSSLPLAKSLWMWCGAKEGVYLWSECWKSPCGNVKRRWEVLLEIQWKFCRAVCGSTRSHRASVQFKTPLNAEWWWWWTQQLSGAHSVN